MAASAARDERPERPGTAPEPAPIPRRRRPVAGPRVVVPTATVWWARLEHRGPGLTEHSLVAVNSDRFRDGTPVDLTAIDPCGQRPARWLVDVRYRACDGAVVRIDVAETVAVARRPLWFAELPHATSPVPAASLLAFAGDAFPPGSVVPPSAVAARGLTMQQHVGEVRWWTRSGLVDTVAVAPAARGEGIGRLLVTAAEGLRMLRGWAPLLGDAQVPEDGAAWLARSPLYWRPRLGPEFRPGG